MKIEDHFRIGSVLKTKGLKGEMQLYVDFDGIEAIKFNALFIEIGGKLAPYFVESIKYNQKNSAYLYLAFQHIGILSLEFHVDKLSRPLL